MAFLCAVDRFEIHTGMTGLTVWRMSTRQGCRVGSLEVQDRPVDEVVAFLAARGVDAAQFLTPDALTALADQPTRTG